MIGKPIVLLDLKATIVSHHTICNKDVGDLRPFNAGIHLLEKSI